MLSPKLYKNSHAYDFFIRTLGYESSIERFLRSLDVDHQPACRILDTGCGTGLLGLHFLQRFSDASLLATDLEPNFLDAVITNARRRDLPRDRITLGTANISTPQHVTSLDGKSVELEEASFDLICVGAVLGYADDTTHSIRQLVKLLSPGGQLINLEMNEGMMGRFVSNRYHYKNIQLARLRELIEEAGCEVKTKTLRLRHLPARLTRTAILAKKMA
jgi:SAM-dependent methyltransferase